jgi:hypothetical protein
MPVFHVRWRQSTSFFVIDDGMGAVYQVQGESGNREHPFERSRGVPQDIEDHYRQTDNAVQIEQCELIVGQHYPRIYRPPSRGRIEGLESAHGNSAQAVRTLLAALQEVLRVIEPHASNDGAYGHELRQLLILGCNEVESSFRAVLKANGYSNPGRWSTNDYVKLLPLMRLNEWAVRLPRYPDYPPMKPFAGWSAANPTQSLPWYEAYNGVKHDREQSFHSATFGHALHALAGAVVLVYAQFGLFGLRGMTRELQEIDYASEPTWALSEYYVCPRTGPAGTDPWQVVKHPSLV